MSPRAAKPKSEKAPERWVEAFDASLPDFLGTVRRKMFGYPCVFLGGNMVAGLHGAGLVIRLPAVHRAALVVAGGRPFEPMPGRVMREYVVAPEAFAEDHEELRVWLTRAFEYVGAMPPKEAKARKPKAKAAAAVKAKVIEKKKAAPAKKPRRVPRRR